MSCLSKLVPVSKRQIGPVKGKVNVRARAVGDQTEKPEIYVKRKNISISSQSENLKNGSLYDLNRNNNYLFASPPADRIGRIVEILVKSGRLGEPKKEEKDSKETDVEKKPEIEAKSYPGLDAEGDNPPILDAIKMTISGKSLNGDPILILTKSSRSDNEAKVIRVTTKIPSNKLIGKEQVTTKDLYDIDWVERNNDEIIERKSPYWEDEYTLRLSGFKEAKSKTAVKLSSEWDRLKKEQKKLDQKLKSIGKDRRTLARDRQRLVKARKDIKEKVEGLNSKVEEQKKTIEEQKQTIDELRDKPGDEKDGSDGA